jgi:cytochrome oxidase Cu insertion factor (SCO1/SenC/PrrC family)
MTKTRAWLLLGLMLLISLMLGCSGEEECDPAQVNNAKLEVGDEAPDFRLQDHTGRYIALSDHKGQNNVVIAFYPAAFTPV